MKISEAFDLYKTEYLLIKGLSKRVLQDNEYIKNRLVEAVGDKDVDKLSMADVANWCEKLQFHRLPDGTFVPRKQNTIRNDLTRLKMVLKYLHLRGIDCLNYELIPIPKREDVVRPFLTPEEVSSMIDNACSLRNKVVISLLYASGIRLSELISLNIGSIHDRQFTVVGKGSKARLCFLDDRTEALINEYLSTRDDNCTALIISKSRKSRMTSTNVQLLIKNSAKRAGINKKVSPHILRHSFATNFISNNGNIRVLSTLLGHANVSTTMTYTHVIDKELAQQYYTYHTTSKSK